jgi:hypothetical protein
MSQLFKGMIMGSAITLAAAGGYAFGTSSGQVPSHPQFDSEDLERGECTVNVGPGRLAVGSECRYNQVMVGTRSDYLLCAEIEVTCN